MARHAMKESNVLRSIWLAAAKTTILFRVNTGRAWLSGGGKPIRMRDGSVSLPAARPIALGLSLPNGDPVTGTHDLVGWTPVTITPSMVGKRIAAFTSIEAKNSDGGRQSKEQVTWRDNVQRVGGISGFASSPEEAEAIISDWHKKMESIQQ